MVPMPQNLHIRTADQHSEPGHSLVPPDIVSMAGQDAATAFARFHVDHIDKTQNLQFASAVPEFLQWLRRSTNVLLADIISVNVNDYLKELEIGGLTSGDILSRLCAIDLFMTYLSNIEGLRIERLVHTELRYPVPPRLLVESSSGTLDFVGVYGDFLARHTNPRTRGSYQDSLHRFFDYCINTKIQDIASIRGATLAGFILNCSEKDDNGLVDDKARTVSATMSAVRTLFDLFIVEGLMATNVARAVKLPKIASGVGTTPVLSNDLVARMINMIPLKTPADYRDRALIAIMAYSLFRISAVTKLRVQDYQMRGNLRWIVAIEKRTKVHEMPVHEVLQHYLDEYIMVTGLSEQPEAPLFQGSVPNGSRLTGYAYSRNASWKMLQRRAKAAGHFSEVGNHSLRATGITNFLANGGQLEEARKMAGHKSAETTRIYNRNIDAVDPDEVMRIDYQVKR